MNRSVLALSGPILLLLVGCGAPPLTPVSTLEEEIEIRDSYAVPHLALDDSNEAGEDAANWWQNWGDSAVDEELTRLIDELLDGNHDLAAAAEGVAAARAQVTIAGAGRWPQLAASLQSSRRKQIFVGFPIPSAGGGPASSLSNTHSLSATASWELDLWNRLGQTQRAAVAQWQASEADLAAAKLSLSVRGVQAWVSVIEARNQLDLARRTVDSYETTERTSESRYARGLTSSVDVHLARTQLESARANLELRDQQLQVARRQLELLLGRYPRATIEATSHLPALREGVVAGLPADLLRRRPDLVAAERRLTAGGALTKAARRQLLPRITLTSSAGTTSDQLGDLLNGDFSIWSLAAGVVQPLFQGGRLRAQVRAQRAEEEAALQSYASAALQAFAEVENALDAETRLARRETHLRAATASAQRAAALSEDRYRRGVGSLLQLLESQRRALESESQLVAIEAQRVRARAELHLALGGDFGRNPTRPRAIESTTKHTWAPSTKADR